MHLHRNRQATLNTPTNRPRIPATFLSEIVWREGLPTMNLPHILCLPLYIVVVFFHTSQNSNTNLVISNPPTKPNGVNFIRHKESFLQGGPLPATNGIIVLTPSYPVQTAMRRTPKKAEGNCNNWCNNDQAMTSESRWPQQHCIDLMVPIGMGRTWTVIFMYEKQNIYTD